MIDEKWLGKHDLGYILRMGDCPTENDEDEQIERLVRLGLWAERHAIPALQKYTEVRYVQKTTRDSTLTWWPAREALAALPKGEG